MDTRRARPILFLIAGGLFAVAAARDAFFPQFFARGDGHPAINAAFAFFFIAFGAARQLDKVKESSPQRH
jgi:hypothetical protein